MATEVVWSEPALEELKQVYEYYRSHYSEASAVNLPYKVTDITL